MSGRTLKRSRKSKLVPRSFKDSEDSNNLQNAPKRKQKLSNASSSMVSVQDQPSTSTYQPLQFDIKVEVEECDEFEMEDMIPSPKIKTEIINENDLMEVEEQDINLLLAHAMSTKNGLLLDSSDDESVDNNTNKYTTDLDHDYSPRDQGNTKCVALTTTNSTKPGNKPQRSLHQLEFGEEEILSALDELSKENNLSLADNILRVEARNLWGRCKMTIHEPTLAEKRLQIALNTWKYWKVSSKGGEVPLMYKCYICEKAWWHLGPFQHHLSTHDEELRVEAEPQMQSIEYNIIAYSNKFYHVYNDFKIDSNCWRCGYEYEHHIKHEKQYQCVHCLESFPTCTKHRAHEAECVKKLKSLVKSGPIVVFTCHVCKLKLLYRETLEQHYLEYHDVRSDLPVFVNIRSCTTCSQNYASIAFHFCTKNYNIICHYCGKRFPSKLALDVHISEDSILCVVCHQPLPKKCMLPEHMLKHSTKFMLLYKCLNCKDNVLLLNEKSLRDHKLAQHHQKFDKRRNHFEMVLVPQQLIDAHRGISRVVNEEAVTKVEINPEVEAQRELDMAVQMIGGMSSDSGSRVPIAVMAETNSVAEEIDLEDDIPATSILIKQEPEEFDEIFVKEKMVAAMQNTNFSEDDDGYENILSSVFNASTGMVLENQIAEETNDFDELINKELKKKKSKNSKSSNEMTVIFDNTEIGGDIKLEVVSTIEKVAKTFKCSHQNCNFTALDRTDLEEHRLTHNTVAVTCSKCNETFGTLKEYLSHLSDHGFVKWSCPECLRTYASLAGLNSHVRIVADRLFTKSQFVDKVREKIFVKYQCKKCKEVVQSGSLADHWEKHIETVDIVTSTVKVEITLGEGKVDVDGIQYNESDVEPENLSPEVISDIIANIVVKNKYKRNCPDRGCIVCGRKFERHNDSKRHHIEHLLTNAYSTKAMYNGLRCQICEMVFDRADVYKHHLRGHSHLREYKCNLCFKTFSDSSNYVKHKKTHGGTYICDLCNKKFARRESIIKHLETHTTVDPMPCLCCSRKFYSEIELAQHVRRAHTQTFFRFSCIICRKKFKSLKDKWDHMWLQHKERSIKADCPVCNAEFRKVSDMKTHLKEEHEMCISVMSTKLFKELQQKVIEKQKIGVDPVPNLESELSPYIVVRGDYKKEYEIYSKDDFYRVLLNGMK